MNGEIISLGYCYLVKKKKLDKSIVDQLISMNISGQRINTFNKKEKRIKGNKICM